MSATPSAASNNATMKLPTNLAGVARLILSSETKSIVVLTGAGVSVASGIPDFRSPGGMYETLRPDSLTATNRQRQLMRADPTYVVEKGMFFANPLPYMEVRRPFILGTAQQQWKATLSHRFLELLATETNKLTRVYTQNIDGLDTQCSGIPPAKFCAVHGSIAEIMCENCGARPAMSLDDFCQLVKTQIKDIYDIDPEAPATSTPIHCPHCGEPTVKPSTVLFGSNLPASFFELSDQDMPETDVLIVAGTSLVVSPANSLVYRVPDATFRLLVNRDPVGEELGMEYGEAATRDYFAQGNCDEVFLELIVECGWFDKVLALKDQLAPQSQTLVEQKQAELEQRKKRKHAATTTTTTANQTQNDEANK